jgi:hypothetical protein
MQDLYIEMQNKRKELNRAIKEARERGEGMAEAERKYRIALAKEMLIQRDNKVPVTIISDICRGKENIAKLKFDRDTAEVLYKSANERIQATKLEMRIIENQIEAERRGE